MWLKKIELENFQKHEKFEADFVQGVNILSGETDAGKSCIVRAIKWVMFNEPKGELVRRIGSDRTSVSITLDNDVKIQRLKSNTENAYIVVKDGEENRYDAIGKNVPVDVTNILGVSRMEVDKESLMLNIAPQIALPFLLKDSGTFRMKVFNKLTGNDILDDVAKSFNKDLLRIGRDEKANQEALEKKDEIFSKTNKIKRDKEIILDEVKPLLDRLQNRIDKFEKVENLKGELSDRIARWTLTTTQLEKIPELPEKEVPLLKDRVEKFNNVSGYLTKFNSISEQMDVTVKGIKEVKVPENVDSLISRADRVEIVAHLTCEGRKRVDLYKTIGENIASVERQLETESKEYREILKDNKVCPICQTEMTDEVLEGIKL